MCICIYVRPHSLQLLVDHCLTTLCWCHAGTWLWASWIPAHKVLKSVVTPGNFILSKTRPLARAFCVAKVLSAGCARACQQARRKLSQRMKWNKGWGELRGWPKLLVQGGDWGVILILFGRILFTKTPGKCCLPYFCNPFRNKHGIFL